MIKVIKLRRLRLARHVARLRTRRNHTKFQGEHLKGRDHLGDVSTNWRVILKMDLTEMGCEVVNWIRLDQGRVQWRVVV
jgi:hypothetical protein